MYQKVEKFVIELNLPGGVERHSFEGIKRNAISAARKLAHENRCNYKLKRSKGDSLEN